MYRIVTLLLGCFGLAAIFMGQLLFGELCIALSLALQAVSLFGFMERNSSPDYFLPRKQDSHAHDESQPARGCPRLVGVGHHAGIAQRRTFNGVLAGERRTQQQHSRLGEFPVGIQTIGEFTGVPAEGANQIAVTSIEARDDIG